MRQRYATILPPGMPYQRRIGSIEIFAGSRANFDDSVARHEVDELAAYRFVDTLQTTSPISERAWDLLNDRFFSRRPDVELRVFGYDFSVCDLKFVRRMTNVRRFAADCLQSAINVDCLADLVNPKSLSIKIRDLKDFAILEEVSPAIEDLSLGATASKRPDLAPLARFRALKDLFIERHVKNIEVLGELRSLEDLTLRSVTTKDLAYLAPLDELQYLEIVLGGIRDFTGISGKESLKYLELCWIRGLSDIGVIAQLPGLQNINLRYLSRIRGLPSLRGAARLRRIFLSSMKGLVDFRELEWAPALEELLLMDCRCTEPVQFEPILRNRSLRSFSGFGGDKSGARARERQRQYEKTDFVFTPFEYR